MGVSKISRVLKNKVVDWMKTNSARGDRPYIIVPELIDPRFSPRPTTSAGGTAGAIGGQSGDDGLSSEPMPQDADDQPGGTLPRPGFAPPGGDFGGPVPGGASDKKALEVKTPEGWYAKLGAGSTGFSMNALFPRRPLSVEKRDGDYTFTFKFEVILLSPDEARKTILPAEPKETDPDDSPESVPASPTAANGKQEDRA